MAEVEKRIGVIGGSGLYAMEGLTEVDEVVVETPFGAPSDAIITARLGETAVAFLPRHGRGHRISPSFVNSRANIYALKSLGVNRIVSVSAVGSMREDIAPQHAVIPDQLFDRTFRRVNSFFGDGIVAHISFAEPFCTQMCDLIEDTTRECGGTVHRGGTYICIEGPQFSTKAESCTYRQWGVDIIGMTALPEAKLAREAEICYATLALVTDYDVWHESEEVVSVEMIVENLEKNVQLAQRVLRRVLPALAKHQDCSCQHALQDAIITRKSLIPEDTKQQLKLIIGRYVH